MRASFDITLQISVRSLAENVSEPHQRMTNDGVSMTLPTAFEMMSERIQLISCLALTFELLQHGGVVRIYMPLHVTLAEATQAIQKPDVVC